MTFSQAALRCIRLLSYPAHVLVWLWLVIGMANNALADDYWNAALGDWFDAGNWLDGSVPTCSDNVYIDDATAAFVTTPGSYADSRTLEALRRGFNIPTTSIYPNKLLSFFFRFNPNPVFDQK